MDAARVAVAKDILAARSKAKKGSSRAGDGTATNGGGGAGAGDGGGDGDGEGDGEGGDPIEQCRKLAMPQRVRLALSKSQASTKKKSSTAASKKKRSTGIRDSRGGFGSAARGRGRAGALVARGRGGGVRSACGDHGTGGGGARNDSAGRGALVQTTVGRKKSSGVRLGSPRPSSAAKAVVASSNAPQSSRA